MTAIPDKTAADPQQIIAELERKLDERTSERDEALERQTATAEILKVIASSPSDVQPVFEAIATSANRLIGGYSTTVFSIVDDIMHLSALTPTSPAADAALKARFPAPLSANPWAEQIRNGEIVNVADIETESAVPADLRDVWRMRGFRALLLVPLRRDRASIGVISLTRREPGTFAAHDVQLLQTFGDHAVIAIENARLFGEVQAKTRDLTEALTYQIGSSNILSVIASSPTVVGPVLKAIVESACELCDAFDAAVLLKDGEDLRFSAHHGPIPIGLEKWPINRNWAAGRAFLDQKPVHVHDLLSDENADFPDGREMAHRMGHRTTLNVPLLSEGESIGTIGLRRTEVHPFSDKQIALLRTFADQAVIAIENTRLFNETKEALERQTATADILKVIASSPDDVQPVFQAIADRSNRLVNALSTTVFMLNDGMMHLRAFTPTNPEADTALQAMFPAPLSTFSWGESIRRGDIYRVIDTKHEPEGLRDLARLRGWRSCLCVPLLRDGKPIGMIGPTRVEPGPFTDHHVQLLQTFADQAVIAISNVGLFNEVQERTRELSASLDNLRTAQDRLVQTEKLASLGQLTAGIAHEIKNPLNFVNNFSALSAELIDELDETLAPAPLDQKMRGDVGVLTQMLKSNLEKVVQHGKRADSIVKNMLLHSREGSGEHRSADINALVEESLNLAYHGARAEKRGFNVTLKRDLDPDAGAVELYPQEITRALLNLISNGFYAATQRKSEEGETFEPVLIAATKNLGKTVEIRIRDNGTGIPSDVKEKMFNPFFTTKPSGEGTGLGLSMSHDIIVKQHGGSIDVETEPGLFTEFKIVLPRTSQR
jgi:signal transduction histidine kinase/uncharacterized membrane-anchored protein YhcB (DUF1043 family)